jgi:hypothetical protein
MFLVVCFFVSRSDKQLVVLDSIVIFVSGSRRIYVRIILSQDAGSRVIPAPCIVDRMVKLLLVLASTVILVLRVPRDS